MDAKRARTLVRIRAIEDDIAKNDWAQKRRATIDAEAAYERFDESLRQAGHTDGAVPAPVFLTRASSISGGVATRKRLAETVARAAVVEEEFRLLWQETRQRREGVERLQEKIERIEGEAEQKSAQDLIDDVTSARHGRSVA